MKRVGAHVSTSRGIEISPINANEIGAKAFAIFTKNQRRWKSKPLSQENIFSFKKNCDKFNYKTKYILPHAGYLINLGNPDKIKLIKSRAAFEDELKRCEQLGLNMLNFHPGSHLNQISVEDCIKTIAESINIALDKTKYVTAVIENTAGQGSNIGYNFEQIRRIMEKIPNKKRIGVCLDTCHAFAAGYDFRTKKAFEQTMEEFAKIIGLEYLRGVHLNDSKKGLKSKTDRHASIGEGEIGLDAFKYFMNDDRFEEIPMILETPNHEIWEKEIKLLYNLVNKRTH